MSKPLSFPYRKIQPYPADIGVALTDFVIAWVGRDSGDAALCQVGAVLACHLTACQRNWKVKYSIL